jgi:hypothetical protein
METVSVEPRQYETSDMLGGDYTRQPRQIVKRQHRARSNLHGLIVGVLLLFVLALVATSSSSAGAPVATIFSLVAKFTRHVEALPDDEIVRLASIASKPGGTKTVGKLLATQNLSNEVLEDSYLRIAVQQQHMTRPEAEGMFSRLRGTEGFRTTLRKIIGNSPVKSSGHLNELRIADVAAQRGFAVRGIGVRFYDGIKESETDVDVLLEWKGTLVAIEAKDYRSDTTVVLDKFRADMDSLVAFVKQRPLQKVEPVFTLTREPEEAVSWLMLQHAAQSRGVELIKGSPEEQIEQIKMLVRIP